jgi:hypothetical protein
MSRASSSVSQVVGLHVFELSSIAVLEHVTDGPGALSDISKEQE